ncbi:mitochondrial folate transporter/carrier, partial [Trifolium pratense]
GLRGLYAGFLAGAVGSTISSGLGLLYYVKAKQRHAIAMSSEEKYIPDLASAMEAGALKSFFASEDKTAASDTSSSGTAICWAIWTIKREEGFSALFRGIVPSLFMVSYIAIHVTVYEELRKTIVNLKTKGSKIQHQNPDQILNSVDFAVLGATSRVAAIFPTYPFQVIRTRLQQRPDSDGIPRYRNSWHIVKEIARFEGVRGFYKGITPNLLINIPVASMTFIVYENVLKLLKLAKRND